MQRSSTTRRPLAPLSSEDRATLRKWRRAMLIFYGILSVLLAALAVAAGLAHPSTRAGQQVAHSTPASAGPQH